MTLNNYLVDYNVHDCGCLLHHLIRLYYIYWNYIDHSICIYILLYKHDIYLLCQSLIMSGLTASNECILITRSRAREVTGWIDHVKPDRNRSGFFHWV